MLDNAIATCYSWAGAKKGFKMFYTNADGSMVYFSTEHNKIIKTLDPRSISLHDFVFFEEDEMIELMNLKIQLCTED